MSKNEIIQGHALNKLRLMPDESVNACVTSPPYWGLRDYGTEPLIWLTNSEIERLRNEP